MLRVSACYHPTKILFLDDSEIFLQLIDSGLRAEYYTFELFTQVDDLLEKVNHKYKFTPYTNRYVTLIDEMEYQHRRIDVDLCKIHHEIYEPARFNTISTVVIDYDMPSMNGLEVCKKINNEYIQKILLTGVSNEHLAVEAFNKGIINHFIKKHDPQMLTKLENALLQSQMKYFSLLSATIAKTIESDKARNSALDEAAFTELFYYLTNRYNIVEYYIIDPIGCFLLIDKVGQTYGLYVADNEIMDSMIIEAIDHNGKRDVEIATSLMNREKILCYHNRFHLNIPYVDKWEKYLYKANKLEGAEKSYYWAFAPNLIDINHQHFHSFEDYQNNLTNLSKSLFK